MKLEANVFDVWVFRNAPAGVEYLLLKTAQLKADRHFNGGRFWQIPSGFTVGDEDIVTAIDRLLGRFGLAASAVWAAEHAYTIYNRRFASMQIIGVFAAQVSAAVVIMDPQEHSEYRWCPFDAALQAVTFRGLKDGLQSTREYVSGRATPPPELRLR
jgi:dihydroneopterin triphosphate diphosphatase